MVLGTHPTPDPPTENTQRRLQGLKEHHIHRDQGRDGRACLEEGPYQIRPKELWKNTWAACGIGAAGEVWGYLDTFRPDLFNAKRIMFRSDQRPFALYHFVSCLRGGGCNPVKNHSSPFSLQSLESSQDKWNDASHCIACHCNFSSAGNAPEMKLLHDPQANSIQGAKSQHDHRCGHGGFAIRDLYQITSHACRLFTKGASQLSREENLVPEL